MESGQKPNVTRTTPPKGLDAAGWEKIRESIDSLGFGSVEVIVHDRRVVQIERREKIRFDPVPKPSDLK